MSQSTTTIDHDEIRRWAEERGGRPSVVRTGRGRGGILRFDFGEDDEKLEETSWEEFFRIFDESKLAFLHQDEVGSGGTSRFFKFVSQGSRSGSKGTRKAASTKRAFSGRAASASKRTPSKSGSSKSGSSKSAKRASKTGATKRSGGTLASTSQKRTARTSAGKSSASKRSGTAATSGSRSGAKGGGSKRASGGSRKGQGGSRSASRK